MAGTVSQRKQPSFPMGLLKGMDPQTANAFKEVVKYLGRAVTMQTETGSDIPKRYNTALKRTEVLVGGEWVAEQGAVAQVVTSGSGNSSGSSGSSGGSGSTIQGVAPLKTINPAQMILKYLASLAVDASDNLYVVNDGHTHATQYLGLTDQAADSDKLDGIDSTGFLLAGGTAVDSDKVDGSHAAAFVTHALATAENDVLVGAPNPFGAWVKKTLAEFKSILGLGSAAYTASGDYLAAGATAVDSDKVDGQHASAFAPAPAFLTLDADYDVQVSDKGATIVADTSGGDLTATLPASPADGLHFTFVKLGAGRLTLDGNGANIQGAATLYNDVASETQAAITICGVNGEWAIVATGVGTWTTGVAGGPWFLLLFDA